MCRVNYCFAQQNKFKFGTVLMLLEIGLFLIMLVWSFLRLRKSAVNPSAKILLTLLLAGLLVLHISFFAVLPRV